MRFCHARRGSFLSGARSTARRTGAVSTARTHLDARDDSRGPRACATCRARSARAGSPAGNTRRGPRGHPVEAGEVVGLRHGPPVASVICSAPAKAMRFILHAHRGQVAGSGRDAGVHREAGGPGEAARRREVHGRVAALGAVDRRPVARLHRLFAQEVLAEDQDRLRPGSGARPRESRSTVPRTASSLRRVVVLTRCAVVCAADLHDAMGSAQLRQRSRGRRREIAGPRARARIRCCPRGRGRCRRGPAAPCPPSWLLPAPSGDAFSTTAASASVIESSLWERLSRFPRSLSSTARRSARPFPTLSTQPDVAAGGDSSVTSSSGAGRTRSHSLDCGLHLAADDRREAKVVDQEDQRAAGLRGDVFVRAEERRKRWAAWGRGRLRRRALRSPRCVWGRPSSRMVKSSRVRPRTGVPDLSSTTASTVMAETCEGKDGGTVICGRGPWAPASGERRLIKTAATISVERIPASVYC